MADVLSVTVDRERDPDGSKLDALVAAWLTYERARRTRRALLCATLGVGVILLLRAQWAPLCAPHAVALVLAFSATIGVCAALAGISEWWRYRLWTRSLSAMRGLRPGA